MIKLNYYPRVRLEHRARRGTRPSELELPAPINLSSIPKATEDIIGKNQRPLRSLRRAEMRPLTRPDLPPCRRCLKTISFYRRQTPSTPLNDMCDSLPSPRGLMDATMQSRKCLSCEEVQRSVDADINGTRCCFDASYKEVCCEGNDDSVAHSVYPNCFLLCRK